MYVKTIGVIFTNAFSIGIQIPNREINMINDAPISDETIAGHKATV